MASLSGGCQRRWDSDRWGAWECLPIPKPSCLRNSSLKGLLLAIMICLSPNWNAANETARFQAAASSCVAPVVILLRSNWVQLVRTYGILGHSATHFRISGTRKLAWPSGGGGQRCPAGRSSEDIWQWIYIIYIYGCFLKWWYPTTMGFPTKMIILGCFGGIAI